MAETTTVSASKPKKPVASAAPAYEAPKFEAPKFEIPKFEMPKFDMPNMEMPAAFRELAEKGIAQAKENYEKVKSAAEQATDVLEDTYSAASKGYADLGLKLIDNARTNTNAAFDLYGELLTSKSYAEVVEKSTAYVRAQFESLTSQAKEFTELAQKTVSATAEPVKESFSSFGKVA
jgi:phasin